MILQIDISSPNSSMTLPIPVSVSVKTLTTENYETLRVKLGSMIHRKLAAITPDIINLMNNVPDKWRSLLQEAFTATHTALNESFSQIRTASNKNLTNTSFSRKEKIIPTKDIQINIYIDGLQPYVLYKRLLSLALLVRSMADNPLLPSEIFSRPQRQFLPSMDISLKQVEKLLGGLEEGVTISISSLLSPSTLALIQYKERIPFEIIRQKISVRKIQKFLRKYLNTNKLIVPRCMRFSMLPGYLSGINRIKFRQVVHDPYWSQSIIAEIYHFKIMYDITACKLGFPPILLPQAVSAFHYMRWGSVYVAERVIHDLFNSILIYSPSIPRLKLFAAFFGVINSDEKDKAACAILGNPHALCKYLDLLIELHREIKINKDKKANNEKKSKGDGGKVSKKMKNNSISFEMDSLGVLSISGRGIDRDCEKEIESETTGIIHGLQVKGTLKKDIDNTDEFSSSSSFSTSSSSLSFVLPCIDTLFPSTDSPFTRMDRRDVWLLEKKILKRAVRRWALSLKAQHGADYYEDNAMGTFFKELPELIKMNVKGEIDVDDFLYLIMMQWAKLTSLSVARCESKIVIAENKNPYFKVAETEKNDRKIRREEEMLLEEQKEMKKQIISPLLLQSKSGSLTGTGTGTGTGIGVGGNSLIETKDVNRDIKRDEIPAPINSSSLAKNPFSGLFLSNLVESSYTHIGK